MSTIQSSSMPFSRQFEVSATSGVLRSITESVAKKMQTNALIDTVRFLPKRQLDFQKQIHVQSKVLETIQKLDKKAAKRIRLMRQGSSESQNAYPCIFMKHKNLPPNKADRLKTLDTSSHQGVWVQFNDVKQ